MTMVQFQNLQSWRSRHSQPLFYNDVADLLVPRDSIDKNLRGGVRNVDLAARSLPLDNDGHYLRTIAHRIHGRRAGGTIGTGASNRRARKCGHRWLYYQQSQDS